MAKKQVDKNIEEIKKLLKTKKIIFGSDVTMKELKRGGIAKIFLAGNTAKPISDDVEYYSGLAGAAVVKLDYPNSELGALCKKPFPVSVIGIRK
jgi:large subunit ribosomal protein L30e